jgi:hypothetical protein
MPAEDGFYCQCVGCEVISNSTPGCVIREKPDGIYEFNGVTPHGGVKAVLIFTNDEGEIVPKPDASTLKFVSSMPKVMCFPCSLALPTRKVFRSNNVQRSKGESKMNNTTDAPQIVDINIIGATTEFSPPFNAV